MSIVHECKKFPEFHDCIFVTSNGDELDRNEQFLSLPENHKIYAVNPRTSRSEYTYGDERLQAKKSK